MTFICVRPEKREPVTVVESVEASVEEGLIGDHFNGKPGDKCMVTLIQAEHIDFVSNVMDQKVDPALLRRNIVVSGINLLALKNKTFQIGEAILEGTKPCPPCSRMEENLGLGGYNAMRGHGGINARVIQSGKISVGDSLTVLQNESSVGAADE